MEFECSLLFAAPNAIIASSNGNIRPDKYDPQEDLTMSHISKFPCAISILCYRSICDISIAVKYLENEKTLVIPLITRFNWMLYFSSPSSCYSHMKELFSTNAGNMNEYLFLDSYNLLDSKTVHMRLFPPQISTLAVTPFSLDSDDCSRLASSLTDANKVNIVFSKAQGIHCINQIPILETAGLIDIIFPYIGPPKKRRERLDFGLTSSTLNTVDHQQIKADIENELQNILINKFSSELRNNLQVAGCSINSVIPINLGSSLCSPMSSVVSRITQEAEQQNISLTNIQVLSSFNGKAISLSRKVSNALLNQIYVNIINENNNNNNNENQFDDDSITSSLTQPKTLKTENSSLDCFYLDDMIILPTENKEENILLVQGDYDFNKEQSIQQDINKLLVHMKIKPGKLGASTLDCNIQDQQIAKQIETLLSQSILIFEAPLLGSIDNNSLLYTKSEKNFLEKTHYDSSENMFHSLLVPTGSTVVNGISTAKTSNESGNDIGELLKLSGINIISPALVVSLPTMVWGPKDWPELKKIQSIFPKLNEKNTASVMSTIFSNSDKIPSIDDLDNIRNFLAISLGTSSVTGETDFIDTPKIRVMCAPTKPINIYQICSETVDAAIKVITESKGKTDNKIGIEDAADITVMAKKFLEAIFKDINISYWKNASQLFSRSISCGKTQFAKIPLNIINKLQNSKIYSSSHMVLSLPTTADEDMITDIAQRQLQCSVEWERNSRAKDTEINNLKLKISKMDQEYMEKLEQQLQLMEIHATVGSESIQSQNNGTLLVTPKYMNKEIFSGNSGSNSIPNNAGSGLLFTVSNDVVGVNGKIKYGSCLDCNTSSCNSSAANLSAAEEWADHSGSNRLISSGLQSAHALPRLQSYQSSIASSSTSSISLATSLFGVSDNVLAGIIAETMREFDDANKTNLEYTEITTNTIIDDSGRRKIIKKIKKRRGESAMHAN